MWHGLRANAVIRLRTAGHSALLISDTIGMSPEMVGRYSRQQDKTESALAVLKEMHERAAVKLPQNGQQK